MKYNEKLNELFNRWEESYSEEERRFKFCRDGLMHKADSNLDVDELWGNAERRVVFLLKDNPDGGHDIRCWLIDKTKGEKNRNLGNLFLRNIAKMFYGLLRDKADFRVGNQMADENMEDVKKVFNTEAFALIETKKLAGRPSVSPKEIEQALERDGNFLKEELDILQPNIIVCCDASDTQFKFITQNYFSGKKGEKIEYSYQLEDGTTVPRMRKCCLWYNETDKVVVIKSYHPSAGMGWKIFERVISPFHVYLSSHVSNNLI